MCHLEPKFAVAFTGGARGEISALLDLLLKEIGCFQHCDNRQKGPAWGPLKNKTLVPCYLFPIAPKTGEAPWIAANIAELAGLTRQRQYFLWPGATARAFCMCNRFFTWPGAL